MSESEQEAKELAQKWVKAFNDRNVDLVRDCMHFPNVRLASSSVILIKTVEDWRSPFESMEKEGWDYSTLDSMETFHVSEDKVHLGVVFTRYRADGTSYATHRSLWIITKKDGRWGIQGRSSFAP
jgi:hypothetical protein